MDKGEEEERKGESWWPLLDGSPLWQRTHEKHAQQHSSTKFLRKDACWRGLSLEVIPSSPYFKRSVNDQFKTISDCQHKVKRKKACLIPLTSTSLNLHANSQLFVSAPKIKAIAWLALQIILFSSELEGNLEVIISNPLILQIRKLNKAKTDKVAYPSSQSHFSEKVFFWFLVMILVLHNHSEYREWERKVPQRMGQGLLEAATSGEEKVGKAGHLCLGNQAWGCSLADSLPLVTAYTLQQMTVFPKTRRAFSSAAFGLMWQSMMSSSQCLLPSRSSE